jgi:hypothetical protein
MSFDVQNAAHVAGGEVVPLKPIELVGIDVTPSIDTLSSQVTGAGDTVLVARSTGGVARVFGYVKELPAEEVTLVDEANYLTTGQAVWFALVLMRHKNAGAFSKLWVPGTVAAVASAVEPTFAEIATYLGLDEKNSTFAIVGSIRFHRSADTVIDVATKSIGRPYYTDTAKKTGEMADTTDPSTLVAYPGGHMDFHVDLTDFYGLGAGALAVDGAKLPEFPWGGEVSYYEYIPGEDGAGAGGDITLRTGISGTADTTSDLQILLAATALGSAPTGASPTGSQFAPGDNLDIEVEAAPTAFTAGAGILRVFLKEYRPY